MMPDDEKQAAVKQVVAATANAIRVMGVGEGINTCIGALVEFNMQPFGVGREQVEETCEEMRQVLAKRVRLHGRIGEQN